VDLSSDRLLMMMMISIAWEFSLPVTRMVLEHKIIRINLKKESYCLLIGAWGSVVVKVLRYKSMGPGIDPRWFR
jgi:hypothetical protein